MYTLFYRKVFLATRYVLYKHVLKAYNQNQVFGIVYR